MLDRINEIDDLSFLDQEFSNDQVMDKIYKIDKLGKEIEIGGQTSYQNKYFVLNETEFPTGTIGKSRQAIFEACVRIDNLKNLVFEYHKTQGEIKIAKAKTIKTKQKLIQAKTIAKQPSIKTQNEEIDLLIAEGKYEIAIAKLRQKELTVDSLKSKAKHYLRCINDFYTEFEKNEKICKKQFNTSILDWNKEDVENQYWQTVNDKKLIKARLYQKSSLPKELGDGLPLQDNMNFKRIEMIDKALDEKINEDSNNALDEKINEDSWVIVVDENFLTKAPKNCPKYKKGVCIQINRLCSIETCRSLGIVQE